MCACKNVFVSVSNVCRFWPHIWMSPKPDQPETFREKGDVPTDKLLIATISPNNTGLGWLCCYVWPEIQMSLCVCAALLDHRPLQPEPHGCACLNFYAWSSSGTNAQNCEEPGIPAFQNAKPYNVRKIKWNVPQRQGKPDSGNEKYERTPKIFRRCSQ